MIDTPKEAATGDKAARDLMLSELLQVCTPAPWTVVDNGIWDISIKAGGTVCHINSKGDWFPSGKDTLVGRSQNKMLRDAKLIALAPTIAAELIKERALNAKLLEALKGVVKVADRATIEFYAAHAAIAKAEGVQP
jgi:hypothetical protein